MGMAERIKELISMEEACRRYGFEVGRGGFMQCPFHKGDRTASLKIYPGNCGWHCFGCNKGGSVVDFVMELFGISFKQALLRINADFNLGLSNAKPSRQDYSAMLERRQAEQRAKERKEEEFRGTIRRMWWCRDIIAAFPPTLNGDDIYIHPFYEAAVKELPFVEHLVEGFFRKGDEAHWAKFQTSHGTIT